MTTAYEQLQSAGETLFKRYITFYQPANRRKGKAVSDTRITMHWVGRASYQQGEGWIELAWWPEVLPHLFGLKQQFTRYRLELATRLRSIYSWKILELLSQFEDKQTGGGWRQMTLEDLEESLELPPSMRGLFGQLKRKALDPAVKELADKEGFLITYKTIKTGRRVTAVKFTFQRDRQGRLF